MARDSCAVASLSNLFGKTPPPAPPCPDLSGGSLSTTTTTAPPCTGGVTSTITVSLVEGGNGATYTFTATGTVENERSDPIKNVSVSYSYGLPGSAEDEWASWIQNGDSSIGSIPPSGSAPFSASATFSPIYVRPVEPSANVISVTYSDTSSGPGCGNG